MKWWKTLIEKWRKFIEETAKVNEEMWRGEKPSCCAKDKDKR